MSQLQVTGEAKIRDIQGPVVSNSGVITALDGDASQYVRGDGTLADFPTSTGGGSSVSYYLNSSVSQGTIGGVAYRELSKEPIIGAGTDIAISANGYVANYLTDANDPDVLSIPGGNFNCEFYFSVNNNTGNPTTYAELYKYDGTTFTLLGTSAGVPESINQGTTIAPYYFAIPVATAALSVTDRLAIRIYVNVSGRTVTLHTENGHLCQVVTTLSKGMVSLNNLTDQSQYLATGTSGTNFAIVSSGDTHTFNLPVASATNTGKLSSTDWSTFNGKVPYTGATANVDLGTNSLFAYDLFANGNGTNNANLYLKQGIASLLIQNGYSNILATGTKIGFQVATSAIAAYYADFQFSSLTAQRTFTLPDLSGTLALLEGTQTFSGSKTFSAATLVNTIYIDGVSYLKNLTTTSYITGYTTYSAKANGVIEYFFPSSFKSVLDFNDAADYTYTFPASSGTLALTSDLGSYVTLATTQTISGAKTFSSSPIIDNGTSGIPLRFKQYSSTNFGLAGYTDIIPIGATLIAFAFGQTGADTKIAYFSAASLTNNVPKEYTLPNATGTLALLSGTQTFTGDTTFSNDLLVNGVRVGIGSGGSNNARFGALSFMSNTTGGYNTAIGTYTLNANTTGGNNTALGNVALSLNTTGSNNTAIGGSALANITTGSSNIGLGNSSGGSITTGSNNTIIGNYAGTAAMSNNIVLADGAGNIRYQWDGTNNVFGNPISGTSATFSGLVEIGNTVGSSINSASGLGNLVVGNGGASSQGITIYTGSSTYGGLNFADATSGSGAYAGYIKFDHSNDSMGFFIGNTARLTIASTGAATFSSSVTTNSHIYCDNGAINFGGTSTFTSSDPAIYRVAGNDLVFANSSSERMRITSGGELQVAYSGGAGLIRSQATYTNTSANVANMYVGSAYEFGRGTASSMRYKENIADWDGNGLNTILALQPKTFTYKEEYYKHPERVILGLIAEEVAETCKYLADYENEDGSGQVENVRYSYIVVPLIKAVQELKAEIEELKALIAAK